jgi:hypothetical protein
MQKPLYKELANTIQARLNCEKTENWDWFSRHEEKIDDMARNHLPSGSGIDSGCTIDMEKSNGDRIVIDSSYHTMSDMGYYGRWIDFTVTVKPDLICDFILTISGRFGRDQDLKDYLYDIFDMALRYVVGEPETEGKQRIEFLNKEV